MRSATAFVLAVIGLFTQATRAQNPEGVLPKNTEGQALNLDFEKGSLDHWVAEGEAFEGQPIRGDSVNRRRGDMHSKHAGRFWVGTYEKQGDAPKGTLVSAPFEVNQPFASFLVGGGSHDDVRAELVRHDTGQVIFTARGENVEDMKRVVIDLGPHQGKQLFVRLVDAHSGGWGHINFDDFRFHATKPNIPQAAAPVLVEQAAGLKPEEAAKAMTTRDGFKVTLFAGEPDVVQPIAMSIDDRGRLWVAEAYSYPHRQPANRARDRILILEDADGDGRFDKRKVFAEKLNLVSGLELGFGGVFVGAAPHLLFIPDKNGDDAPDAAPEILLDGWGYQDTHETLNSFIWGPDGWLYGCHGVFTHSNVGKPGTPEKDRQPINAGIWRYHPTKKKFEVFAWGTSNPWGVDFNDRGQCFLTSCVIPHLFHITQGGRYFRQAGQHFGEHVYDDIKTIADHLHYTGNIRDHAWWGHTPGLANEVASAGGGHAHAGAMIYLGDAWPDDFRDKIFMNNIHGARVNMDVLKPKGSGFVGSHGDDFLVANDSWSQLLYFRYGPDGQMFMIDWYDKNQCHRTDPITHDRTNGRIYKVSYVGTATANKTPLPGSLPADQAAGRERVASASEPGEGAEEEDDAQTSPTHPNPLPQGERELASLAPEDAPPSSKTSRAIDLKKKTDDELVELQLHKNDWYVRQARRILQERGPNPKVHAALTTMALEHADETRRLRGLWALHATGGINESFALQGLANDSEYVRAWTVQLTCEEGKPSAKVLEKLAGMAKDDRSPVVRKYIASALQRVEPSSRLPILAALFQHGEDASDHNLPLLYWYAFEPVVPADMPRALDLASSSKLSRILEYTVRRIASSDKSDAIAMLIGGLGRATNVAQQRTILDGVQAALKGRRRVPMPTGWTEVARKLTAAGSPELTRRVTNLSVVFGDPEAIAGMRKLLADTKADAEARQAALEALLAAKDPQIVEVLHGLLADPPLRRSALRALAAYDNPKTASLILKQYGALSAAERGDALGTLASRPAFALELLASVESGAVASRDVTADVVRQLRNLNNTGINEQIQKVWGMVRETPAEKAALIAQYKDLVTRSGPGPDPALGRAIFAKTCQKCHKLFGTGGDVGPDITGSNRTNLDYLLSNILDPSSVMAKEYLQTVIATTDGRVITGIVKKEDKNALTIATANEVIVLPVGEVDARNTSNQSMMPEDQLKPMTDHDVRSLVAYLQSGQQTPMLATAENIKDFFNGQDLTGWTGNPKLWSVENGEIVGKTTGLKENEFLASDLVLGDFRLKLKVKLVPNAGNSGIQFRSSARPDGHVAGYQADVGVGWWGKLYEELGRGLLWPKSGEEHVKLEEWNDYEILAVGDHLRTFINGKPCVDLTDPPGAKRGIIAFQLHSGPAMEVRYKDMKIELNPTGEN